MIAQNSLQFIRNVFRSLSNGKLIGKINHVAIAVKDLNKSTNLFKILGIEIPKAQILPNHGVNVKFLNLGETKMEFLEPIDDSSPISKYLSKRNGGIHHICIETSDIDQVLKLLKQNKISTLTETTKIGAHGKPVIFLDPQDCNGVLFEFQQI
ncbi:DL-methylmalonyl-CoA racemase [Intoshia linei]|uniref:DL-methylmalonyl-CoA racemase n=1 Tax=Intoshia linei TaxID=1819745 RepID=A0A177B2W6_9BILA|nr:DL-methylmalonyl-CoA racemase [Intoshia linei]